MQVLHAIGIAVLLGFYVFVIAMVVLALVETAIDWWRR